MIQLGCIGFIAVWFLITMNVKNHGGYFLECAAFALLPAIFAFSAIYSLALLFLGAFGVFNK